MAGTGRCPLPHRCAAHAPLLSSRSSHWTAHSRDFQIKTFDTDAPATSPPAGARDTSDHSQDHPQAAGRKPTTACDARRASKGATAGSVRRDSGLVIHARSAERGTLSLVLVLLLLLIIVVLLGFLQPLDEGLDVVEKHVAAAHNRALLVPEVDRVLADDVELVQSLDDLDKDLRRWYVRAGNGQMSNAQRSSHTRLPDKRKKAFEELSARQKRVTLGQANVNAILEKANWRFKRCPARQLSSPAQPGSPDTWAARISLAHDRVPALQPILTRERSRLCKAWLSWPCAHALAPHLEQLAVFVAHDLDAV